MHQPDENILERALPGMQVLEADPDVAHPAEQRGHPRRLRLAVEFIDELVPVARKLEFPVGNLARDGLQRLGESGELGRASFGEGVCTEGSVSGVGGEYKKKKKKKG